MELARLATIEMLGMSKPTRVLLARVKMEETARMVSMDLRVRVLQDMLEFTVVST